MEGEAEGALAEMPLELTETIVVVPVWVSRTNTDCNPLGLPARGASDWKAT